MRVCAYVKVKVCRCFCEGVCMYIVRICMCPCLPAMIVPVRECMSFGHMWLGVGV